MPVRVLLPPDEPQFWILANLDTREIYGAPMDLRTLFFSRIPFTLSNDLRTEIECMSDTIAPPRDTDEESMDITDAMLDALVTPPIPAPWCNGRIICLGSIPAPEADHPLEFYNFPIALRRDLRRAINPLPVPGPFEISRRTLYYATQATFKFVPLLEGASGSDVPQGIKERTKEAKKAAREMQPFFLRNHTTEEFVSGHVLGAFGTVHGVPLSLGHALLVRACWFWAPHETVRSCTPEGMHRGAWAAHVVDVVHEDEWPRKLRRMWRNVSEEVSKEVVSVWKAADVVG